MNDIKVVDDLALVLFKQNTDKATEYLTSYSVLTGNKLVNDWKKFYHYLFMKYIDGNVKNSADRKLLENGNGKNIPKAPAQPGYGKEWERIMIQGTGDRLKAPKEDNK